MVAGNYWQNKFQQTQWTESIAVGSKNFIETIKENLGILAKGRKILENDGCFQLRKEMGRNDNLKNKYERQMGSDQANRLN